MAGEAPFGGWTVAFVENVRVVIRELFAGLNLPDGLDPDPPILYHCIAVRIAGMIDEPRLISAYGSIDDDVVVDSEEVGVVPASIVGVPGIRLGRSQPLPGVLNYPHPRPDWPDSKPPESLNGRGANFK